MPGKKYSPWSQMKTGASEPMMTEREYIEQQVRMKPYAAPVAYAARVPVGTNPVPVTLTGDMVSSSPRQIAAAAQFDANMRASAPPLEAETPMEMADRLEVEAYRKAQALKNSR